MEVNLTQGFITIICGVLTLVFGLYFFFKFFIRRSADQTEKKEREWEGYNNYLTASDLKKNLEWEKKQMEDLKNVRK